MMRLVRGTPLVRAVATAMAALLVLSGIVPMVAYPLLRIDAASYESAIGNPGRECPGDPIPARGGCWSAAAARVTVRGVDAQTTATFVVVAVANQPATREDLVTTPPAQIGVGTALTARYWHDSVAMLVLPAATRSAQPVALPTRDNPTYRAQDLPTGSAVVLLVGLGGLLVWGRPLLDDMRAWRERKRHAAQAEIEARESTSSPTFGRGLARYGIDLQVATATAPDDDVVLTGHRDATADTAEAGWNVRQR